MESPIPSLGLRGQAVAICPAVGKRLNALGERRAERATPLVNSRIRITHLGVRLQGSPWEPGVGCFKRLHPQV